jgi:cytochrome c
MAVTEPVAPKVVAAAVSDADGIALAKKRNCFACHLVDKKVVGPAWKDVAAKYRGDAGAQARMETKIGKGGSGAWGSMAMPPQPQVTPEERAVLARFILNLK